MQKPGVVGATDKFENVEGCVGVRCKSVAKVGIEIGEAGAIDDQIEILLQGASYIKTQTQPGLGDIALDHLDFIAQEHGQEVAVAIEERIEYRRVFDHLLEAAFTGIRLLTANQQIDSLHFRQFQQRIGEPDFADEPGHANQQHLLAGKSAAHRKSRKLFLAVKVNDRAHSRWPLSMCRSNRGPQFFEGDVEMAGESFRSTAAVRHVLAERSEGAAGTNHRFEQPAGCGAVTEFQAVRNDALDAEMLRQRAHHVVECLTDQYYVSA